MESTSSLMEQSQSPLSEATVLAARGRVLAAAAMLPSDDNELGEEELSAAATLRASADSVRRAHSALASFESSSGSGDKAGLSVDYTQLSSRDHLLLVSGRLLHASILSVLAVAREWDLVKDWSRFLYDTVVVSVESVFAVTVYGSLWCPPPLSDRDFALRICGFDCIDETGSIVLLFSDAHPDAADLPSAAKNRVRMRFHEGAVRLAPRQDGTGTIGSLRVRLDPCLPGGITPPAWAVRWALDLLIPFLFNACGRQAAAVPSSPVYQARMAANAPLYALVESRLGGLEQLDGATQAAALLAAPL